MSKGIKWWLGVKRDDERDVVSLGVAANKSGVEVKAIDIRAEYGFIDHCDLIKVLRAFADYIEKG